MPPPSTRLTSGNGTTNRSKVPALISSRRRGAAGPLIAALRPPRGTAGLAALDERVPLAALTAAAHPAQ